MGMMKRFGLPILEDIHIDGIATRKELWERNQVCGWAQFKRMISWLRADGMIKNVPCRGNFIENIGLTPKGEQTVKELLNS